MNLLTIDIGNTNTRFYDHFKNRFIKKVENFNNYEKVIYSSVLSKKDLQKRFSYLDFNQCLNAKDYIKSDMFLDMPLNYEPNELGIDRILCAYALFPNLNEKDEITIIDSGTFTTIDHLNSQGFQSGYIAPGIYSYLLAYSQGSKLPIMSAKELLENSNLPLTAHKTHEAIAKTIKITYLSLVNIFLVSNKCVYTGGDAETMQSLINIQGHQEPHLIHAGMKNLAKRI